MPAHAQIHPFPKRGPQPDDTDRRLTVRDRLDLHAWGERIAAAGLRCVIGRDSSALSHDFVQLHRTADGAPAATVAWTVVRQGADIRVWRGACGRDLGTFPSVEAALATVLAGATTGRAAAH